MDPDEPDRTLKLQQEKLGMLHYRNSESICDVLIVDRQHQSF